MIARDISLQSFAALPFICLQAIGDALCIIFPQIVLYLPHQLYAGH